MSFQWIIDNAESISINSRPNVVGTTSIDGTFRSTSLGNAPWRFEVKLPDGAPWQEYRSAIATAEALDRITAGNIQISDSGQTSWLNKYLGNAASTSGATCYVSDLGGNAITITSGLSVSSGQYRLRAGDFVQIGSAGKVYKVVADVTSSTSTVQLNRSVFENTGSHNLIIGPAVTWNVRCIEFPQWTIFARDQVSWSGPFVFVENLA